MNVNTASEQVLRSLDQRITAGIADDLVAAVTSENKGKGFDTPADFRADSNIASFNISTDGLDVSSNYFGLMSEVNRNDATIRYTSRLYRDQAGNIDTVKRSRSLL